MRWHVAWDGIVDLPGHGVSLAESVVAPHCLQRPHHCCHCKIPSYKIPLLRLGRSTAPPMESNPRSEVFDPGHRPHDVGCSKCSRRHTGAGQPEAARAETALHPSTAHRILGVMVESSARRPHRAGHATASASGCSSWATWSSRASTCARKRCRTCSALHQQLGETVNL